MEIKIAGKYRLIKKIGKGSYGEIYQALNIKSNENVAVKMEPVSTKTPSVQYEYSLYKLMEGSSGIAKVHYFGTEGDYYLIVMDMLGPSLEALHVFCERSFSESTVAKIGLQCITLLESLHEKGLIHRDIKPDNFLIGIGKKED